MLQETQADRDATKALEDSLGFLNCHEMPVVLAAFATHREQAVRPLVEALGRLMNWSIAISNLGGWEDLDFAKNALAKARGEIKENG